MNQSIDKLANLLLARKAIHSLPANTSLTLREISALVLECQGNTSAAKAAAETVTSAMRSPPTASDRSYSALRGSDKDVYHQTRHPHQAPLSLTQNTTTANNHSFAASTIQFESSHRFQVSIRQLSSNSNSKSDRKQ